MIIFPFALHCLLLLLKLILFAAIHLPKSSNPLFLRSAEAGFES